MKKNIILFILVLMAFHAESQDECMQIGTNFHFFDAGVYKDLKLSSSGFFTRNAVYLDDGNDWDSGLAATMPQNDAGYPLEIPFPHPETGAEQIVAFTVGGYGLNYLPGDYVLLHDGTAEFYIPNWIGATITSVSEGRVEFNVHTVDENGIHIEILSSPVGDPIRNIRIVETTYESNFESEPLHPAFSSKADEFTALRFMDWTHTNGHPAVQWSDRTANGFHTQNLPDTGMSWERVIEISNALEKDVWINIPHLADENYISQLALLFRDQLNPELTIYLEYSNECWNWIFDQTHWLDSAAPHNNYALNYGHFSKRVFEIWDEAFSGQEQRIQTVLAGHDYFVLDAFTLFDDDNTTDLVDLVSYPGYVGLNENDYATLDALGASATAEDVMTMLRANEADNFYWMQQFKTLVADEYDKEFVMYEGGQHLTPEWFGLDAPYNQALYDAQTHPDMYVFYQDMLDYYRDELEVGLFMNYVLASPQETAFGSWGLLDNYFVETPYSPKWNAVMDWKNSQSCTTTSIQGIDEVLLEVFPNPTMDELHVGTDRRMDFNIIDMNGKTIKAGILDTHILDVRNLPSGIYVLRLMEGGQHQTIKFVKE